jgi:hypothetical protein
LAKIGVPAQQEQSLAIEFLNWNNFELSQRVTLPNDDAMLFGEEVELTQSTPFFWDRPSNYQVQPVPDELVG